MEVDATRQVEGVGTIPLLRRREGEWQDAHGDRNLAKCAIPLAGDDLAAVDARPLAARGADGQEELLEGVRVQGDRLQGGGVAEIFAEGVEAVGVDLRRRGDPDLRAVAKAGVVGLLFEIDLDQSLVVEEKFGNELQAAVGKETDPAVSVLEPELHDAQVGRERGLRRRGGRFPRIRRGGGVARQRGDFEFDLAEGAESEELKRSGLESVLRYDGAQSAGDASVIGIGVHQPHDVAHRGDGVPGDVAAFAGAFPVGRDTGAVRWGGFGCARELKVEDRVPGRHRCCRQSGGEEQKR